MWIMSSKGFYSIVQKDWDVKKGTLTVRSRVFSDLNGLRQYIPNMEDIKTDDGSDYRHRIQAPKKDVALAAAKLVKQVNYRNFKDEIGLQNHDRAVIYGDIWNLLTELETIDDEEAEGK